MSLPRLFSPRSIAVIGASHTVGSVGNDLVKNITQGYKGKIFPINPKGGQLYNLPVLTNLKHLPQQVDLAVIAVPAAVVPIVLKEVGQHKIPAAIVISAGFREIGNLDGEHALVKIAEKYKITLVGPN
jgi:acyl-CoA synthetase (NDP forming)